MLTRSSDGGVSAAQACMHRPVRMRESRPGLQCFFLKKEAGAEATTLSTCTHACRTTTGVYHPAHHTCTTHNRQHTSAQKTSGSWAPAQPFKIHIGYPRSACFSPSAIRQESTMVTEFSEWRHHMTAISMRLCLALSLKEEEAARMRREEKYPDVEGVEDRSR